MEVNQSTKSETWCTQSFNIYQSGLQNQGWFQKKCKKCQTFVRETSLQSSLKKGAVPYLFVATWTPRYVVSIDSLIGGHLRKETQGLALQQVSGWVMRVMGGLDGWMDANIERCTDGRWQVMSKEIPTSSWMAYIYINVCYMYTYRVFFLHSIRYIMYASIYLAAVEGHFCQQLLPQVLSSCSARPKKIAQQFPGGPFFFFWLAHSSAATISSEKFKIQKIFKAVLFGRIGYPTKIGCLDLELLDLEPLFHWVLLYQGSARTPVPSRIRPGAAPRPPRCGSPRRQRTPRRCGIGRSPEMG